MPVWLSWLLPVLALVLGVLGGILGAQVSPVAFWLLWTPGLVCVGAFIWLVDRKPKEDQG